MEDPPGTLGGLLAELGLRGSETLAAPSWNGETLEEVYPWGTLCAMTPGANRATASELSDAEVDAIRALARQYLDEFSYADFMVGTGM